MIIKNCPAIKEITTLLTSEPPQFQKEWRCCTTGSNLKKCENITDCVMKKIVEKCREADGKVVGYTKGKVYDSDAEKLIEKDIPLITKNPLAEEILELLDIEE